MGLSYMIHLILEFVKGVVDNDLLIMGCFLMDMITMSLIS